MSFDISKLRLGCVFENLSRVDPWGGSSQTALPSQRQRKRMQRISHPAPKKEKEQTEEKPEVSGEPYRAIGAVCKGQRVSEEESIKVDGVAATGRLEKMRIKVWSLELSPQRSRGFSRMWFP